MTTPLPPPPPPPVINLPSLDVTAKLPQEVLNKLVPPPQHSWLYSNGATLISAGVTLLGVVVAIVVAAIAWCSVQRQISAENNRQIRRDKLDALTSAAGVVTEIWYWTFQNLDPTPARSEDVVRSVADMQLKVVTVKAKFDLLGMTEEREAVKAYYQEAERANSVGKVTALGLSRESLVQQLTKPIS